MQKAGARIPGPERSIEVEDSSSGPADADSVKKLLA